LLLETVASSALRPATVQLQDVATIASTTVDLPGLSYDSVYDISTDSSVSMCEEPLATSIIIHSRIKAPTLVHTNTSIMPKKRNKGLGSEAAVASAELSPQITNLPPYIDLKDLITLPCMDCGSDDNHKWDCHLGSKSSCTQQNLVILTNLRSEVQGRTYDSRLSYSSRCC
jgi:hypothetical protein